MALPRHTCVVPLALACLPVHGCTQLSEGAVEVSWSLYDDTGAATNCKKTGIDEITLYWDVTGAERHHLPFPCDDYHGVTDFRIPVGTASLWLQPHCPTGDAVVGTFTSPPPIVRTISAGEVVTLDTQILQLETFRSCDGADPCFCAP